MEINTILTDRQTDRQTDSTWFNLKSSKNSGFTIVELLVTIVIIAVLAAIVTVSYRGITGKANEAALTSDLANAKKQFALYYTEHSVYPIALDSGNCPTNPSVSPADTNYCLKISSGTTFTLNKDANSLHYSIKATKGNLIYSVSDTRQPSPTINTATDTNWITVGSQTWAKTNLNVGTRIDGANNQINNSTVEKYCYNNDEANCTTYGALYQWGEAMQYTNSEGAQGICPTGSHIPTDNDWKVLEMQLGMTQTEADKKDVWRGTDQGAQLKLGGASGIDIPLPGLRQISGSFNVSGTDAYLWSSSVADSTHAINRYLLSAYNTVSRSATVKSFGFSMRCLAN